MTALKEPYAGDRTVPQPEMTPEAISSAEDEARATHARMTAYYDAVRADPTDRNPDGSYPLGLRSWDDPRLLLPHVDLDAEFSRVVPTAAKARVDAVRWEPSCKWKVRQIVTEPDDPEAHEGNHLALLDEVGGPRVLWSRVIPNQLKVGDCINGQVFTLPDGTTGVGKRL